MIQYLRNIVRIEYIHFAILGFPKHSGKLLDDVKK